MNISIIQLQQLYYTLDKVRAEPQPIVAINKSPT